MLQGASKPSFAIRPSGPMAKEGLDFLSPLTQRGITSVSVLSDNCALVDGLATAGMLFTSASEARDWAQRVQKERPELSFWIVSRDQDITQ